MTDPDMHKDTEVLRGMAESFPKGSREYQLLENVALAYIFSLTFHEEEFEEFRRSNQIPIV